MKLISWNVNGLRACIGKGFADFFQSADADVVCLQETKLQEGQINFAPEGYFSYWNYALKKGYSGTVIFTRRKPLSVRYGMGEEIHDQEGRLITLEYPAFYLLTVYTPNAQRGLTRLEYRLDWETSFRRYVKALDRKKPVVLCGDLNVAHQEIDLKNAKSNKGNAGFTQEERDAFSALLDEGFADTFRRLYPDKTDGYTWWSYMYNARANNAGWRIDYFVVSERLMPQVKDAGIEASVMGSDHCPISLELDI